MLVVSFMLQAGCSSRIELHHPMHLSTKIIKSLKAGLTIP